MCSRNKAFVKYILKRDFESSFIILFMFLLSLCALACKDSSQTATITDDDIWEIMDEVEIATLNKDIDGVMKHLAPSVLIRVSVETPYGPQRVKRSREEYKKETLDLWSMTSHNEYRRENEEIKISDDGQVAVVETDIIESHVIEGQTVDSETYERVTLEIIDGHILVTKIDAFIRMHSDDYLSPLL
jgi:hypothetical protein